MLYDIKNLLKRHFFQSDCLTFLSRYSESAVTLTAHLAPWKMLMVCRSLAPLHMTSCFTLPPLASLRTSRGRCLLSILPLREATVWLELPSSSSSICLVLVQIRRSCRGNACLEFAIYLSYRDYYVI